MTKVKAENAEILSRTEQVLEAVYRKLYDALEYFPGSFIAGGSIASLILDEQPKDYDVWFETIEDYELALKRAHLASTKGACEVVGVGPHAVTIRVPGISAEIQLIKSRIGSYYSVLTSFDFKHTHAAYLAPQALSPTVTVPGTLLFQSGNSVEFIQSKVLEFEGLLPYPVHTLSRVTKFALRGYTVPNATYMRLVRAINDASKGLIDKDLAASGSTYAGNTYTGSSAA